MEKEASSTDDPSSFTLLVSCPSGLSPSQVSVAFSDAYDRIPHSDVILENTISEIWKQRSQKNNSLFNGKKFRDFCGDKFKSFVGKVPDDSVLCQHTSNPLGNGAVVETNDNKILVLQRSDNVGEFPGHFVFPGGHPEICNLRSTDAALQRCVRCWTNARHGCGPDSYAMRYQVRSPSLDMVGPTDMRDWTRTR
ncbi:Nudix hydrolase 9 [Glycine max]|nr:Nudix hydrolase 9 [Glycine max]